MARPYFCATATRLLLYFLKKPGAFVGKGKLRKPDTRARIREAAEALRIGGRP